jgi:hypothetical protein
MPGHHAEPNRKILGIQAIYGQAALEIRERPGHRRIEETRRALEGMIG